MSIALLTAILSSCQKDNIQAPKNDNLKWQEVAQRPIKLQASPGGTETLPVVVIYSNIVVKFGWENNGTFQVHNVTSSISSSSGAFTTTWQQGNTFWANSPNNPDIVNIIVMGTYTYIIAGKLTADIKEAVMIQIIYNKRTGEKTAIVSRTQDPIMVPR